jgi:hypothetical protein
VSERYSLRAVVTLCTRWRRRGVEGSGEGAKREGAYKSAGCKRHVGPARDVATAPSRCRSISGKVKVRERERKKRTRNSFHFIFYC